MRVAVLMGGPSSEHDVSLAGGGKVVAALDPARFDVRPVVITREGAWRVAPAKRKAARFQMAPVGIGGGGDFDPHESEQWTALDGPLEGLAELKAWGADLVFPVLHGHFGEDGIVQACLRAAGLAFVGSGHRGSAIAFDKVRAKEVVTLHGIHTPAYEVFTKDALVRGRADTIGGWIERLGTPLVLKNPLGGSSLEVKIANDAGEAASALDELVPPAEHILIEAFIEGREITAGVIDDPTDGLIALPVVEIVVRNGVTFDYHEKYHEDGAREICPAPIDAEVTAEAQRIAIAVHRILGLRGLSRTDFRMSADGRLWFLEVNTMPGMTDRGLVPLAAKQHGVDFPTLIGRLIRTAATPD